jgi:hypothetical protein
MEPQLWCPSCGAQTRPGEHFCWNCGNGLLAAPPASKPPQPIMGDATSSNSPDRWSVRKGVQAIGPKLWIIGSSCLVLLAGSGLLGLLGVLGRSAGGGLLFFLWFLGWGIYGARVNYKRAFPSRKEERAARTLFRLFEIVVVILGLLGLLAGIFKIGSAWSWLMGLPFLINVPLASYLLRRTQRTSYPNAQQTHFDGLTWTVTAATSSWSADGKQADQGMRYVTVTLQIDNPSSRDFATSCGDYLRLQAGETTSAPTPHASIPTLIPAGSSGQTGSASFLVPAGHTSYTLLFLRNATSGVSQAAVDFQTFGPFG